MTEQPKGKEEEELILWIRKPFNKGSLVITRFKVIPRDQYEAMERIIIGISRTLGVDATDLAEHIRTLLKPHDVADLQAQIDCLLKENRELKTQMAAKET